MLDNFHHGLHEACLAAQSDDKGDEMPSPAELAAARRELKESEEAVFSGEVGMPTRGSETQVVNSGDEVEMVCDPFDPESEVDPSRPSKMNPWPVERVQRKRNTKTPVPLM